MDRRSRRARANACEAPIPKPALRCAPGPSSSSPSLRRRSTAQSFQFQIDHERRVICYRRSERFPRWNIRAFQESTARVEDLSVLPVMTLCSQATILTKYCTTNMPLQRMASEISISSSTPLALYNMSLNLREDADILLKRQWHKQLNVISDVS